MVVTVSSTFIAISSYLFINIPPLYPFFLHNYFFCVDGEKERGEERCCPVEIPERGKETGVFCLEIKAC
jgi:hypothetical protein